MVFSNVLKNDISNFDFPFWRAAAVFSLIFLFTVFINAQNLQLKENILTIEEVKDAEVFAFGKTVVVKKEAKGVLVLGGDIIVEGRIEGDAATIGGSIIQKEPGFIGGDVIVIGGKYQHEAETPLRNPNKETVMYAGYEEELRNMMQNPSQIFSPDLSWSFLAQRAVSVLFWFVLGLILMTISPGAVGKAVSRIRITATKVFGIGVLTFITVTIAVILGFGTLPGYLSGIIVLPVLLLLIFAYVYGRVTLQVFIGKYLQKTFSEERKHSEAAAVLLGTLVLTILTSLPYIGAITVFFLFAAGTGLVLTSRSKEIWIKT